MTTKIYSSSAAAFLKNESRDYLLNLRCFDPFQAHTSDWDTVGDGVNAQGVLQSEETKI